MYYIEKECNFTPFQSKAFDLYFKGLRFGVLDIETTGLNPAYTRFVLGGLLTESAEKDSQLFAQFFAETPDEEAEILQAYFAAIAPLDVVLTFNGKHFDLPFLQKRARELGVLMPSPMPYNLDLYLVLNGHSDLRKLLPNLKQKTVESFMGLWASRDDEISGAESVALYNQYVRRPDPALRETILLHNSDDVIQLYRLLPVLSRSEFHKAMYTMGFPLAGANSASLFDDRPTLLVRSFALSGPTLRIAGSQVKNPLDYIAYSGSESPYSLVFDKSEGSFEAEIPVHRKSGLVFLDLQSLGITYSELKKYPSCESDFLVIKNGKSINYMELNHFTKLFLATILEVI